MTLLDVAIVVPAALLFAFLVDAIVAVYDRRAARRRAVRGRR